MRRTRNGWVVVVLAALVFSACGGGVDTPTATNLITDFDVTAQEDVAILDDGVAKRLASSDPAAGEYRFKGNVKEVMDLVVGDPVVIPGAGFGLVASVERVGGETVLTLDDATLGDIIDTGTLSWDYDVSWTDLEFDFEETASALLVAALGIDGPIDGLVVAQAGSRTTKVEWSHQGWKFEVELKVVGEKLNFGITGSFNIGGKPQATISGKGWVTGFKYTSDMEFANGVPKDVSTEINGLQGEMELEWHAFRTPAQALTAIAKFNVPVSLPIPIGGPYGIPFTLQLRMAGRIVPELSALDSSSGGQWKVTYSSNQGFSQQGEIGAPKGVLLNKNIGTSGETVTAGQGPAGFGLGLEFPRFELSFAGKKPWAFITIDMYSTSLWTPGTLLTGDIPPCQYGYTKLSAIAGYELQFLGAGSIKDQYVLWEEQVDKYLDGKRCTLTGD